MRIATHRVCGALFANLPAGLLAGLLAVCLVAVSCPRASAQATPAVLPVSPEAPDRPPTLEEIRGEMGIASQGDIRGQLDTVGFASTAEQMARVWELAAVPPRPDSLGVRPAAGVAAVICPHDDYVYAGRMYREVLPLVTARTVVVIGVFHRWRRFGARDVLVFDPYRAWRAPDGEIPVSPLREELIARLPVGACVQDAAMHDSEHSIEALASWLRHADAEIEIVPILVATSSFDRLQVLARELGAALATAMAERGWRLGRDLAIAISADAVHYGPDFQHAPFGAGGVDAYTLATARDRNLLSGPLAGPLGGAAGLQKLRDFYETCVDPADPGQYRLPWCGRFSIPFGLLLLREAAATLGEQAPVGFPLAYATSVGWPELPVRQLGLGETAPANLYHFVGYPGAAYLTADVR